MKQEIAYGILKTGRNVFITGSAGTGKTYLLNKYINYLKERGIKPSIVAPTGIAASHIGGITIHSFFGIGIQEYHDEYAIDRLLQKEFLYKRMQDVKVLIIDEISMVSPHIFSLMDKVLRGFKYSDKPFGGIQVILSGDFFQLPPVSKLKDAGRFAWQAETWKDANLRSCYLHEKFRQSEEELIKILDQIRENKVTKKSLETLKNCDGKKFKKGMKVSRLFTHNIDVDRINKEELAKLKEVSRIFISKNKGSKKNVEKIFNSSLLQEKLILKQNSVVIFIKNNYEKGYVNGTLGEVIGFMNITGLPVVKTFDGKKIIVEKENWEFENLKGEVKAQVTQVPLRLAWALTVHKSQGMTLDGAEIDLSKTFETGQGYVALSRIKSLKGLKLLGINDKALQVDKTILQIDKRINESSKMFERKFKAFTKSQVQKMHDDHIISYGGTLKKEEIESNKKDISKKDKGDKIMSVRKNTLNETKKLLTKKNSLKEIAKKREISQKTILTHIKKISEKYPNVNIEYLKPKDSVIKKVKKAIKELEIKKCKDDFLENGNIKLRAIFKFLREKVSYEEINLVIIFINRKQ